MDDYALAVFAILSVHAAGEPHLQCGLFFVFSRTLNYCSHWLDMSKTKKLVAIALPNFPRWEAGRGCVWGLQRHLSQHSHPFDDLPLLRILSGYFCIFSRFFPVAFHAI